MTDGPVTEREPGQHEVVDGRLRIELPMRWNDQDAFQHVNNATMFTILEEARVRAFFRTGDEPAPPTAILEAGLAAGTLTLIASHHIEYLLPVPYRRAPLLVDLWFGRLGGSSAELCYEVRTSPDAEPAVIAASTFVMVEATSGRPRRLSDEERSAWEPFLGEPLRFRR